jgi:hypothetical protein
MIREGRGLLPLGRARLTEIPAFAGMTTIFNEAMKMKGPRSGGMERRLLLLGRPTQSYLPILTNRANRSASA